MVANTFCRLAGAAVVLWAAVGCDQPGAATSTGGQPSTPQVATERPEIAKQTMLLTVSLEPTGKVSLTPLALKSFAYRTASVPFEPALMTPQHAGTRNATVVPTAVDSPSQGTVDDQPGTTPQESAKRRPATADFLLARAPGLEVPHVVMLSLGYAGEGANDVADRWQHGAVIAHAPYFGDGTTYELVRVEDQRPIRLAEVGGAL